MVRNRPPVASHAPGDGTRKARLPGRAEKCPPHGRGRPAGVASRPPRRGPDRGGGRAAGGGAWHGGTVPQVTGDVPLRLAVAGHAQRIKR
jgi:hypothetical protein